MRRAVWLLARGQDFITVRGLPVFGHHASFGLLLFAPASWLGAGPNVLNVVQVTVLTPIGNDVPDLGAQVKLASGSPGASAGS